MRSQRPKPKIGNMDLEDVCFEENIVLQDFIHPTE
jgi:hypothetical protein